MNDDQSNIKLYIAVIVVCGAFFALDVPRPEVPLPNNMEFVQQVTNSKPVIVRFGARWCPRCERLQTELDRLARNYDNRVHVVNIDIDREPGLAAHYSVRTIPHVMLFQFGEQVSEFKGSRSAEEIADWAGLKP